MAMCPLSTENWTETTDTMHRIRQTATGDMRFPPRLDGFHQRTKVADFTNHFPKRPEHRLLAPKASATHAVPPSRGAACCDFTKIDLATPANTKLTLPKTHLTNAHTNSRFPPLHSLLTLALVVCWSLYSPETL